MYAVIKTGGKQYQVSEGDVLKIEKLSVEEGEVVVFDQVLMIVNGEAINIGTPLLSGATVSATVVAHGRGKKIEIIKLKRRKHHMKHQGHRQDFTQVKITGIAA